MRDGDRKNLILCFNIHQPMRLNKQAQAVDDISQAIDHDANKQVIERLARNCFIPANLLLLRLIEQYPEIKITFSISGLAIEQLEMYAPQALESFKRLAATGNVDFVAEPYYHSMSFLLESDEFEVQILKHAEKLIEHFDVRPTVFKNTRLMYSRDIGKRISMMGFQGIITEGTHQLTDSSSPNLVLEDQNNPSLKIFTRNQALSDDLAFRSGDGPWKISPDEFVTRLEAVSKSDSTIVLGADYETFGGEATSGNSLNFLERLLLLVAIQKNLLFSTPGELVKTTDPDKIISFPDLISISGSSLSDWIGNEYQHRAFSSLTALEQKVRSANRAEAEELWRCMQSIDNFHYMRDFHPAHQSVSPFSSSSEAFETYMHILDQIQNIISTESSETSEKQNDVREVERRTIHDPVWARGKSRTGNL